MTISFRIQRVMERPEPSLSEKSRTQRKIWALSCYNGIDAADAERYNNNLLRYRGIGEAEL